MPANTLVFAWGNPSRGDDALGPLFAEAVQAMNLPQVECLTDFQLQVEHTLDLVGRQRICLSMLLVACRMACSRRFIVRPCTQHAIAAIPPMP